MLTIQQKDIEGYLQHLKTEGIGKPSLNHSGIFLKIITQFGEEISGKLCSFNNSFIEVKLPFNPDDKNKHVLSTKNIRSVTCLDRTYLPKLAHDWLHRREVNDIWLVEVFRKCTQGNENTQKLIGRLSINLKHERHFDATFFHIRTKPRDPNSDRVFTYACVESINVLYCSQSYEKDRKDLISQSLSSKMISHVCDYIAGDIPDCVPEIWREFFS